MPEAVMFHPEVPDSGFSACCASACMLPGHFPNTCFKEMLKTLRPHGFIVFAIRDDMMNNATDQGCDFVGKLSSLVAAGEIELVVSTPYQKYKGLSLGPCMSETPAAIKIYKKL